MHETVTDTQEILFLSLFGVLDMIHIALSVYDPKGTYARHAGVVIASVLRNTNENVCFHILHDETLTKENRRRLEETANTSFSKSSREGHGTVDFVDVSTAFSSADDVDLEKISLRFTRGALFRLMLPDIMSHMDRIIYLDCDIVVTMDINDLWQKDLKGHAFAAVPLRNVITEDDALPLPSDSIKRSEIKTNAKGLNNERYINSGVLLLNLNKMRKTLSEGTMFKKAVHYIVAHGSALPDEEFLNVEYLGDILFLERRYNADPGDESYDDVFSMHRIWHFGGHSKIWDAFSGSNADVLYWHYLALTPWKEELIPSMLKAGTNPKYYHRHSCGCVKRLKTQITEEIKNALKFRK